MAGWGRTGTRLRRARAGAGRLSWWRWAWRSSATSRCGATTCPTSASSPTLPPEPLSAGPPSA
eukprot:458048-Rhodomonas_salina.1